MLAKINDPSQSFFHSKELHQLSTSPFTAKDSYHFNLLSLHNRKPSYDTTLGNAVKKQ